MISVDIKLKDIYNLPAFTEVKDHIICGGRKFFKKDSGNLTLRELNTQKQITWDADDMVYGLRRLQEVAESGEEFVFNPYDLGGKKVRGDVRRVALARFPHKGGDTVILASGGAYGAVCNLAEAFPVAARLNELGYDCFCLSYRTATPASFIHGLLPKPLDDMAAAVKFIRDNAEKLGANFNCYSIVGFSAGAHVCACWGCENVGYRKYGLPAPQRIMLAYPLVDMTAIEGPMAEFMYKGLLGHKYTREQIEEYSPIFHTDSQYPPTYIVQASDDTTVSPQKSEEFANILRNLNVRAEAEIVASGGHGFGLGSKTPARDWIARAVVFR